MAGRARAAVVLERRRLRTRLAVAPPESCDDAMVRDGIRRAPPTGTGPQAWWLRQLVGSTPLAAWADLGSPAELLGWAGGEWRDVLVGGWRDAALRQRDAGWAAALLDHKPAEQDLAGFVRVLPPDRRAAPVTRLLRGDRTYWLLPPLLDACPGPWPDDLTAAALDTVVRKDTGPREARDLLVLFGSRLPPGRDGAVRDRAARLRDTDWGPALDAVADTLAFRHTMLEELR